MHIKRILFATDFSPASRSALSYATALARDSGAMLLIVHAKAPIPPLLVSTKRLALSATVVSDPELKTRLEEIVPGDKAVCYAHRLISGLPADEIVRVAKEEDIDLIVMGTHGRTGLSRMLMGSVAEAVLSRAECPVLRVKQPTVAGEGRRKTREQTRLCWE